MQHHVVDNRVLLLGLDALYREAVKRHERGELLQCARIVASALRVGPADGPVAGYYGEDESLGEYYRLLRALQGIDGGRMPEVTDLPAFRRLQVVCGAPLFGQAEDEGKLLPVGRDPLTEALNRTRPQWSVHGLTAAASMAARASDDFSLVGLAARAEDPAVLVALRESVVLYAQAGVFSMEIRPEFVWAVDPDLAEAAQRFVDAFNTLFDERLPDATASHCERYWVAHDEEDIIGRCVGLGQDLNGRCYHWAICRASGGGPTVQDFWSDDAWTTKSYRAALGVGGLCPDRLVANSQDQYGDVVL